MRNFVGAVVALVLSTSATLAADPVGTYEISGTNPRGRVKVFRHGSCSAHGRHVSSHGDYGWSGVRRSWYWKK